MCLLEVVIAQFLLIPRGDVLDTLVNRGMRCAAYGSGKWRWYIIVCDRVDRVLIFYGWMVHRAEPGGRFIRTDLASMRAYFGITIERDLEFVACRLSEVQQRERES